jgi:uncharacterized BrkB/YihY/UPF0761 family membrane protein
MNQDRLKLLRPMLVVFVFLSAFFVTGRSFLIKKQADPDVLLIGNLLLFGVSLLAFLISYKALKSTNPQSFVRAMYGSFIVKFFVIAIAAFVYIMVTKKNVNKPSLIGCMVLYAVYTFLEVSALMKLLKRKRNA